SSLSFWIGIPILASLSLGTEFQHRTFPMLLSQPIGRMQVWAEKWLVTGGAVLTAFLVHWFVHGASFSTFGLVWVVTAMCSATFWTLVARSTVGGVVLNVLQAIGMVIAANLAEWVFELQPSVTVTRAPLVAAALAYALVTLSLGWRKLARFQ